MSCTWNAAGLAVAIGVASARGAPAQRAETDRYAGHFVYSWEGGGFFVPCGAGNGPRGEGLAREFFFYLRADSIRWLAGRMPDRSHEGASTFVVLRVPRLVGASGDTLQQRFHAHADSMGLPSARDCEGTAPPW